MEPTSPLYICLLLTHPRLCITCADAYYLPYILLSTIGIRGFIYNDELRNFLEAVLTMPVALHLAHTYNPRNLWTQISLSIFAKTPSRAVINLMYIALVPMGPWRVDRISAW